MPVLRVGSMTGAKYGEWLPGRDEPSLGHRAEHCLGVRTAPEPEDGGYARGFTEDANVLAGGDQRHGQQALRTEVTGEGGHGGLSRNGSLTTSAC